MTINRIYAGIAGITLAAGLAVGLLPASSAAARVAFKTGVEVHSIRLSLRLPGKLKPGTIDVTAGTLLSGSGEVQPIEYRNGEEDALLAAHIGGGDGGVFTVVLDSQHGAVTGRRAHGTFLLGGKASNGCQLEGAGNWISSVNYNSSKSHTGENITAEGMLTVVCQAG